MNDNGHEDWLPIFGAGILVGLIVVVLAIVATEFDVSAFGELNSTDWATLIGAFGAVVIGGWISWLLQTRGAKTARREAQKQAEEEKLERQMAQAVALIGKVQVIANGFAQQRSYYWDARREANVAEKVTDDLWRWLRPQITTNWPTPSFSAEDFLPLVATGRMDLANGCQEVAAIYNLVENSISVYSDRKESLQAIMLPHSKFNGRGRPITTEAPAHLWPMINIRAAELEDLAWSNYQLVRSGVGTSRKLAADLARCFDVHFPKNFIKLTFVDID
jgi:uncharacterized integral membrane protein